MTLISLLYRISLKHIRHHKLGSFISLFGIALGVAAMVSIDIVNTSVIRSLEESISDITGKAVLQITGSASGFPETMLEQVQKVPGVEYALPVIETDANLAEGSERSFVVLGVDVLQDSNIRNYIVTDDNADIPDPLLFLAKSDSILLTREMATQEGIKIDEKIQVQTVEGTKTFTVRGLLEPEGPAKAMGGDIAIMDIYAAQLAFGKESRIDRIDVSIYEKETLETVRSRIQESLPEGYTIDTPSGRARRVENLMANFRKSMDLISYLVLFVGTYLIYNITSISVVQRKKEIGILRALGATRRQVSALFLAETGALSLIAAIFGIGMGIVLAKLSISTMAQVLSSLYAKSTVTELEFSWNHMLGKACLGVVASIIAAAFPARASARIAPVSAIRSTPYQADGVVVNRLQIVLMGCLFLLAGVIVFVYFTAGPASVIRNSSTAIVVMLILSLGISLATPIFLRGFIKMFHRILAPRLGAGGRLAGLNLEKNISRNAVAVAAVFFGISVSVNSGSMIYSFKKSFMDYIDEVDRSDILITSGHPVASAGASTIPMPLDLAREIEAVPGVEFTHSLRKLFINVSGKRVLLQVVDYPRWAKHNTTTIISGGKFEDLIKRLENGNTISINEAFASRFGLKSGDSILLPTPKGLLRFSVVAIVVSYACDSGVFFMDLQTYQRIWQDPVADMFSVYVKPGFEISAVCDAIREKFKEKRKMFVLPSWEFRSEIKKMIDQSFVLIYAVNLLTLIIAGFGIIVTLLSSVLERTREIGILRSIGMTRKQVSGVILIESALIGLSGGILGIISGMLMGWISLDGFFRTGWGESITYQIHYTSVGLALMFSVGLAIMAGLYPAKRAAKTNITEALSYE